MKRVRKVSMAAVGLMLVSGCASNRQLVQVSERVAELERGRDAFEQEAQGLRTRSADISADFAAIQQKLREIEGRMETAERRPAAAAPRGGGPRDVVDQQMVDRLISLQNRVLDLERRLGVTASAPPPVVVKPVAVPRTPSNPPDLVVVQEPRSPAPPPVPVPAPVVATQMADAGDPDDERHERYRVAYRAFREGRFDEARAEFTRYLAGDPDPDLADNAQFWIADSFYAEKQYEDALVAYDRVIKDYRKGDKVPQALLKQAYCFLQLEYPLDARVLLKKLVDTYPDSPEAKIAKDKLRTIPRR